MSKYKNFCFSELIFSNQDKTRQDSHCDFYYLGVDCSQLMVGGDSSGEGEHISRSGGHWREMGGVIAV